MTIIFFIIMLLYREADPLVLILGVALSGSSEFYWGLKLGTFMLPLLASAGSFLLLNRFFNIRNMVLMVFSGVLMFIVFWEMSILISKIL